MLLEIAVGDAYGACFEGCDKTYVSEKNTLENYVFDYYLPSLVKPGCYTDDTQMSLAVAEAMLDETETWTTESLADRFVQSFQRDQRRGYTTFFLNALLNSDCGTVLLSKINGKSNKSGAAMRSGVLGLIPDIAELKEKCIAQCNVTHDSLIGRASALCAALMTHYFYYDLGPKEELVKWLRSGHFYEDQLSFKYLVHGKKGFTLVEGVETHDGRKRTVNKEYSIWNPKSGHVRVFAWDVVEAAIYAIEEHNSLKKILKQCVDYCGDTDTSAAVAMAAASCCKQIKSDLPPKLIDNLENKTYGKGYLLELDEKLAAKYPRKL